MIPVLVFLSVVSTAAMGLFALLMPYFIYRIRREIKGTNERLDTIARLLRALNRP